MNEVKQYGKGPYSVAVIHGGPGAPGSLSLLAGELARHIPVLEPLQSETTLDGQVCELHDQLEKYGQPPLVLIGHSWGAWLALITAARYPDIAEKLILVGCGPLEHHYAGLIEPVRQSRLTRHEQTDLANAFRTLSQNPHQAGQSALLKSLSRLLEKTDSYRPLAERESDFHFQPDIFKRVWSEANTFRKNGKLMEAVKRVSCPLVIIHGDYDPHPFEGVKKPLADCRNPVTFHLLAQCGHYPWKETGAQDEFYTILHDELQITT